MRMILYYVAKVSFTDERDCRGTRGLTTLYLPSRLARSENDNTTAIGA